MNVDFGRKLETIVRVIGHCEANPDDNAGFTALLNGLKENRARAEMLATQQRAGQLDAKAATSRRSKLRARIHHHMLVPLAKVASSAAAEEPEVDKLFRLPRLNSRTLVWRAAARGMVAEADARKELFLRHGMTDALLTELVSALAEFDGTTDRGNTGRGVHVGATAELSEVIREGMRKVDVFDGLNLYRFRDQPEKLAHWESVKNVPTPSTGKEAPPAGEAPLASAA
jgi:hypothetical protein